MGNTVLVLCVLLQLFTISFGSHEFYGGSVNISPTGNNNEYLVRYQQSWSKTWFSPLCTEVEKNNPAFPIPTYELRYKTNSSYQLLLSQTPLICFDFDDVGNTFSGAGEYLLNTAETGEFQVGFENCCWGYLVGQSNNAGWLLFTKYNPTPRLDNGELNSTPEPLTPHIVQLKNGRNHTIRILSTDQDNDQVRCRLAIGSLECGGVCNNADTLQLILDPITCLLSVDTWNNAANVAIGRYAVAIQIEDYYVNQSLSTKPLSSVGLQLVIEVHNTSITTELNCTCAPPDYSVYNCIKWTKYEIIQKFNGTCYVDKLNAAIERIMELIAQLEALIDTYQQCTMQIQNEIMAYEGSDYSVYFDKLPDCMHLSECRLLWLLTSLMEKKDLLLKEVQYETKTGGYFHSQVAGFLQQMMNNGMD